MGVGWIGKRIYEHPATEKRRGDFYVKSCHGVIAVYPLSATIPFSVHPVSRLVVIRNRR